MPLKIQLLKILNFERITDSQEISKTYTVKSCVFSIQALPILTIVKYQSQEITLIQSAVYTDFSSNVYVYVHMCAALCNFTHV